MTKVFLKITKDVAKSTGEKNLCLAGGVALNCVANGKLIKEKIFDNIWIQQHLVMLEVYSALSIWHHYKKMESKRNDAMGGSYLGPEFTDKEIEKQLLQCKPSTITRNNLSIE